MKLRTQNTTNVDPYFYADKNDFERFGADIAFAGVEPENSAWRAWIETSQGDVQSQVFPLWELAASWAHL